MSLQAQLRSGLKAASLWLPLPAKGRTEFYYDLSSELFQLISGDSGLRNIGYQTAGGGLAETQMQLCRETVRGLPRQGRWLEAGCGEGAAACVLAAENPEVEITGIDLHADSIRRARARAARLGLQKRTRFEVADACRMSWPDQQPFDGLYAVETACHYPDKHAFAREAMRVLRPGGRLALADFVMSEDGEGRPDRALIRWAHQGMGLPRMYTTSQWQGCLETAGFKTLRCVDITRQTFACLPLWVKRIDEIRPDLEKHYSPAVVLCARLNAQVLINRLDGGQLLYTLIEACA